MPKFVTANGTQVDKDDLPTEAVVVEDRFTLTENVYESYQLPGEKGYSGRRLLWHAGQVVTQSAIDAAYAPATFGVIDPDTGPAAGGTAVSIIGTNLRGVTGVTFGGVAATLVVVVTETLVTCTTPAHAAGAVAVVLQDDAGDVSTAGAFTYA